MISGFCPVIFVRSPTALSMIFLSATASPTPMFTVILVIFGTCMTLVEPELLLELGHDLVAILFVSCLGHLIQPSPPHVSTTSLLDLKKRTLRPSASVRMPMRSPFFVTGFHTHTFEMSMRHFLLDDAALDLALRVRLRGASSPC